MPYVPAGAGAVPGMGMGTPGMGIGVPGIGTPGMGVPIGPAGGAPIGAPLSPGAGITAGGGAPILPRALCTRCSYVPKSQPARNRQRQVEAIRAKGLKLVVMMAWCEKRSG